MKSEKSKQYIQRFTFGQLARLFFGSAGNFVASIQSESELFVEQHMLVDRPLQECTGLVPCEVSLAVFPIVVVVRTSPVAGVGQFGLDVLSKTCSQASCFLVDQIVGQVGHLDGEGLFGLVL